MWGISWYMLWSWRLCNSSSAPATHEAWSEDWSTSHQVLGSSGHSMLTGGSSWEVGRLSRLAMKSARRMWSAEGSNVEHQQKGAHVLFPGGLCSTHPNRQWVSIVLQYLTRVYLVHTWPLPSAQAFCLLSCSSTVLEHVARPAKCLLFKGPALWNLATSDTSMIWDQKVWQSVYNPL